MKQNYLKEDGEPPTNIGVLSLQGNIAEHVKILKNLNIQPHYVSHPDDLKDLDGLIIPGGETTTISKLLIKSNLGKAIKEKHKKGMSVFGTCAGAILVSKKILNDKVVKPLGLIDIEIERNSFGRQVDSFETKLNIGAKGIIDAAFIRAPSIKKTGKNVIVLSKFEKTPVLVEGKRVLASTFHTELDNTTALHELFLEKIKTEKNS